jgi:hypothetical protein
MKGIAFQSLSSLFAKCAASLVAFEPSTSIRRSASLQSLCATSSATGHHPGVLKLCAASRDCQETTNRRSAHVHFRQHRERHLRPCSGKARGWRYCSTHARAGSQPNAPAGGVASIQNVDVGAVLTDLASKNSEKLDWKRSIVDLMKLLKLDSSLSARKELAKELGYTGDTNDSATMNIWLHKQVMQKLAANGGKVPADLH